MAAQETANTVKLFEHPDFDDAVLRAAAHFGPRRLRPALIEKDYYVTEALRIIALVYGDRVIFKGGTSLSKGWNLIQRFSEDLDIFVDPNAFEPALGRRGIDRELKRLRDAVDAHPGLTFIPQASHTIGGAGRADRFAFRQRFGGVGEVGGQILVESGTASGREPTAKVELRSHLGEFLTGSGVSLGADDEAGFPMRLLHFRRTFVEKLFAIHARVERFKRDGHAVGPYARHYYDLFELADQHEVLAMLRSDEYAAIKTDYDAVSRAHFASRYVAPPDMRFAESEALFPTPELERTLSADYDTQCRLLCLGPHPPWEQLRARFDALRDLL
jgi:predicted nucleotidyltransferase component of viral defense system